MRTRAHGSSRKVTKYLVRRHKRTCLNSDGVHVPWVTMPTVRSIAPKRRLKPMFGSFCRVCIESAKESTQKFEAREHAGAFGKLRGKVDWDLGAFGRLRSRRQRKMQSELVRHPAKERNQGP